MYPVRRDLIMHERNVYPDAASSAASDSRSTVFSPPVKGVLNFVQYKFSHLAPKERQTMFELSKMFLLCLNYWKLETPTQYRQRTQKDDGTAYKVDYTRHVAASPMAAGTHSWMCVGC